MLLSSSTRPRTGCPVGAPAADMPDKDTQNEMMNMRIPVRIIELLPAKLGGFAGSENT
jgi:hypothetical protein